jgi:hypothetical protein
MIMGDLRLAPADVINLLSGLFRALGPATQLVGGTFGFCVRGDDGGAWTVDMRTPGGAWRTAGESEVAGCDVRIYAFSRVFSAVVFDADMVEDLLETGEVVVEGDHARLVALAKMIAGGGSPLQQQMRQSGAYLEEDNA